MACAASAAEVFDNVMSLPRALAVSRNRCMTSAEAPVTPERVFMVFSKSKPLVTTAETPLVARLAALVIALAARFPTAVPAATIPVVRSALENESPNQRPARPPS
ncbi:Uncharacterised protein [Mycobacteroides abscessus]|uniref:Uncharacterized protein n=1 Tax=Mycobacteroides abscessus subsp. massiliense TaxID=1962118 RepID=A0AB38D7P8_9MYCO|nr:Uncharacterised protein [Mycobacteroides abscessus]SKE05332.1 Uncharacterised protein [Mycobacteroides abscessus subsp. massiliense]CPU08049.1 Uncharacterised protein [Mycobacteroides abscessus]CPU11302.1 Uncharacterised protein [Mycobacteroides abscessus]CPU15623.1 Uncharacterised protein [Mycobacteroides abscessus]